MSGIQGMLGGGSVTGRVDAEAGVTGQVRAQSLTGTARLAQVIDRPAYAGPYVVTPGEEAQVLATEGRRMTGDIVVNPIPDNYGLITWDGSILTVS